MLNTQKRTIRKRVWIVLLASALAIATLAFSEVYTSEMYNKGYEFSLLDYLFPEAATFAVIIILGLAGFAANLFYFTSEKFKKEKYKTAFHVILLSLVLVTFGMALTCAFNCSGVGEEFALLIIFALFALMWFVYIVTLLIIRAREKRKQKQLQNPSAAKKKAEKEEKKKADKESEGKNGEENTDVKESEKAKEPEKPENTPSDENKEEKAEETVVETVVVTTEETINEVIEEAVTESSNTEETNGEGSV